jgi:hypothetical protein
MDSLSSIFTFAHVAAGFSALIVFWIPAFTRKGGINHRRIGNWYVKLMWVVVITAFILCLKNALIGRTQAVIFLGFLVLITAKPLWLGISILDNKRVLSLAYRRANVLLNALVAAAGLALITYGLSLNGSGNAILMYVFGALGLSSVFDLWAGVRSLMAHNTDAPEQKPQWMKEHIANMGVSGIAAHTAFLAFGANSLLPQSYVGQGGLGLVAWISPTVIGVIAIRWSVRKYQPKTVTV